MQTRNLLVLLVLLCLACKHKEGNAGKQQKFDKIKWSATKDGEYINRNQMLKDLIENYEWHGLKEDSILHLLGSPDRIDTGYLFYTIAQEHIGSFPLHTKTLVIKFSKDSTVLWRKIHE
jgi:hypothetical protein